MNNLLFGPLSYEACLQVLVEKISSEKQAQFDKRAMTLAVEGLSNTGKSFLAKRIAQRLHDLSFRTLFIEGDLFQRSREESMREYRFALAEIAQGADVPKDFHSRIWDYEKMHAELFLPLRKFNRGADLEAMLRLRNVLVEKKPGTEHDESYLVDRNTVTLISGMYLRHLYGVGFDRVLFLDADPEKIIQRKLERTARIGVARDPEITRQMVLDIEVPVMQTCLAAIRSIEGLVLDTNDFEQIRGYSLEGYQSPYY